MNEDNLVSLRVSELVEKVIQNLNISTKDSCNCDVFLSRKEAFEFLKIGSTKFNELRQKGIVKPIRLDKKTIYKKSELLKIGDNLK